MQEKSEAEAITGKAVRVRKQTFFASHDSEIQGRPVRCQQGLPHVVQYDPDALVDDPGWSLQQGG
jgi:hypothetical protein